jgi:hypothetical protein
MPWSPVHHHRDPPPDPLVPGRRNRPGPDATRRFRVDSDPAWHGPWSGPREARPCNSAEKYTVDSIMRYYCSVKACTGCPYVLLGLNLGRGQCKVRWHPWHGRPCCTGGSSPSRPCLVLPSHVNLNAKTSDGASLQHQLVHQTHCKFQSPSLRTRSLGLTPNPILSIRWHSTQILNLLRF